MPSFLLRERIPTLLLSSPLLSSPAPSSSQLIYHSSKLRAFQPVLSDFKVQGWPDRTTTKRDTIQDNLFLTHAMDWSLMNFLPFPKRRARSVPGPTQVNKGDNTTRANSDLCRGLSRSLSLSYPSTGNSFRHSQLSTVYVHFDLYFLPGYSRWPIS
ncbi:hypothetical protein GGR50DRAFT_468560 [Xylaria sp. CBS 124048]|nr:hypothetical protein GGR50DRAFT_468560 [Xylaria sp. CBS 124048]